MNRKPLTCASLFSGFGGADLGMIDAGFVPVLAVEHDPAIAAVYAQNFGDGHLVVADVRTVDYRPYAGGVDLLWASPVCTRASIANRNRGESDLDTTCAEAVARAIAEINPPHFIMENVAAYNKFASYKIITDALDSLGYWWEAAVLNASDYDVPQSRVRLILRATRDGFLPPLPSVTPRRGWYDAVSDLLPSCPESKLAHWQIKRLPDGFPGSCAVLVTEQYRQSNKSEERTPQTFQPDSPASTVLANHAGIFRAVLVEGDAAGERAPSLQTEQYRIVALTDRCLARLQTFPDSYQLPAKRSLAAKGIGNAVPPRLAYAVSVGFAAAAAAPSILMTDRLSVKGF